jgi:alpha-D-xyloside xylohydrolase
MHGERSPWYEREHEFRNGVRQLTSGQDNEVWSFGEEAYPILVKYMNRREEMRDYVRGLMQEAHEAGTPLLRAMFYEFPEDGECVDLKDQYMFGDKYLVAPVLEAGARSRSVYLPAGEWKNVETGEILTGGKRVDVAAPLEIIPVFEKL